MSAKIVNYEKWCPLCLYFEKPESEDPCHDCLQEPVNTDSTKPVRWKEKSE